MSNTKPLHIPLKKEYFEAFSDGSKKYELRKPSKVFSLEKCHVGREVILKSGYPKPTETHRILKGRIISCELWNIKTVTSETLGDWMSVLDIYGHIKEVLKIGIEVYHETH